LWIEDLRLGKILEGKIAVHLSDLHMSEIGRREQKVLNVLEEVEPDFIFLTGDYVSWRGKHEAALTFLSKLKAKVGVWAVMGDYDYSYSRKSCLFCHEPGSGKPTRRHSVRFLRNSIERVKLPEGYVQIGAIDEEGERSFFSKAKLLPWGGNDPVIILAHNPLIFNFLDEGQDVLVLSGDTHGGQIPLPSWLWRFLGYEKNARYNQGLFQRDKKKMFVSRGIGTSHFPFRFMRRPEVVVLHFR
jgi:predicted MPP superfamily phosphohydrolase